MKNTAADHTAGQSAEPTKTLRQRSALPLAILVLALSAAALARLPLWTALGVGFAGAFCVALLSGFSFKTLLSASAAGMRRVSKVVILMALINIAIAVWLGSGAIQSLVYYGLRAVQPGGLVVAGFLAATVVSAVLGTAVGTLSTVGVAAMGMGHAGGIRPEILGGSLLSGALLGDRLSPVSPIFHVTLQATRSAERRVWKRALPAEGLSWLLALVIYLVLSNPSRSFAPVSGQALNSFLGEMTGIWPPSPVYCLPPFLVLALALFRVPVSWALAGGIGAGVWAALSRDVRAGEIVWWSVKGFSSHTGLANLDQAFTGGGLVKASNVVLLLLFAGAFNGIMDKTGMFSDLARPAVDRLRSRKAALLGTAGLSLAAATVMSNQLMSIMVPAELTRDIRNQFQIEPETTAAILLASGGVMSPLIPWNIMGVMSSEALGLPAASFAPFSFHVFGVLVLAVLYAVFELP